MVVAIWNALVSLNVFILLVLVLIVILVLDGVDVVSVVSLVCRRRPLRVWPYVNHLPCFWVMRPTFEASSKCDRMCWRSAHLIHAKLP